MLLDLDGGHPGDFLDLVGRVRHLSVVPAIEDQRDDSLGHVLVDTREAWLADRDAGFFEYLPTQALENHLVRFERPTWWFPFAVVATTDRENALTVNYRGGDTHPVFAVGIQAGLHPLEDLYRRVYESYPGAPMALRIDPSSDRPAYRQIADHLRSSILRGQIAPGAPIPSEQELCDRYNAARGTVRQAIGVLRNEGLVLSERGRGTFARERPPVRRLGHDRFARRHRQAGKAAFIAETEAAGRVPEVEVLQVEPIEAPPEVAKRLSIRSSARVLIRRRRYLVDGHPVEMASSYLPWSIVKGSQIVEVDPGPGGIYARLEDMGFKLKHFTEEVSSRMPTPEEANALRLAPGVPVFHLVRTAFDSEEQPLEVCDTVMAGDAYVLAYDLPAR